MSYHDGTYIFESKPWEMSKNLRLTEECREKMIDGWMKAHNMPRHVAEASIREKEHNITLALSLIIPEAFEAGVVRGMEIGRKFRKPNQSNQYESIGQDQFTSKILTKDK